MNLARRMYFVVFLVIAAWPLHAAPVNANSITTESGNTYVSGAEVDVVDPVRSDLICAGGKIRIERAVGADVAIAGGTVEILAPVGQDVRVAGGTVTIRSSIGGELMATGGSVRITGPAAISGPAWIAGGNIVLDGKFDKGATIYANRVALAGQIAGDAHIVAQEILFHPGARIHGNLSYASPAPLSGEASARVGGTITREPLPERRKAGAEAGQRDAGRYWPAWVQLIMLPGLLATGAALYLLFPDAVERARLAIRQQPWGCLALGAALMFTIPPVAMLIMVSVVGLPIGLALFALYPILLLLGFLATAFFVGRLVADRMRQPQQLPRAKQLMFLALALVILALLSWIPLLGGLSLLAALVIGMGAWARSLYRRYRADADNPAAPTNSAAPALPP